MILEIKKPTNLLPVYDQKILDLVNAGNFKKAQWVAEESYEYSKISYGDAHLETAKSLNNLAWIYDLRGQYEAAEIIYRRSIMLKKSLCGKMSVDLIPSLENLSSLYWANGQYGKSEELLKEMIDIVRHYPEPWCFREAIYLTQIAEIKVKQKKMALAESHYHECIAFIERAMPANHPNLGRAFANIADFYKLNGKNKRAEFYYKRAYAVLKKSLSSKHTDTQTILNKLSDLQQRLQETSPQYDTERKSGDV